MQHHKASGYRGKKPKSTLRWSEDKQMENNVIKVVDKPITKSFKAWTLKFIRSMTNQLYLLIVIAGQLESLYKIPLEEQIY